MSDFEWVRCPKCGKEWSSLTADGICYDCREKRRRERVIKEKKEKEAQAPSLAKKVKTFIEESLPDGDMDDEF